jgi:hypothetical protein
VLHKANEVGKYIEPNLTVNLRIAGLAYVGFDLSRHMEADLLQVDIDERVGA